MIGALVALNSGEGGAMVTSGGLLRWQEFGGVETGWDPFTALADQATALAYIIDGGPAKAERAAEAKRDEARYAAEAARYQLELAKAQSSGGAVASAGGASSVMAALARRSPIGVSWGVVLGGAVVVAVAVALAKRRSI